MIKERHLVLDVESVGLHGEGFAVGYVVIDRAGNELESGYAACDPSTASGTQDDFQWIESNVIPHLPLATHDIPRGVRDYFWRVWESWRDEVTLWADCAWPVEANFLSACIKDDALNRGFDGPYPLSEIAVVLMLAGLDPLDIFDRLDTEKPAHHPTKDARQSARLLMTHLGGLYGDGQV